jgi:lysine N6-hydroxylase
VKTKTDGKHHLFVQNGELHTHGVGAPDLGLGAFRSATIINQLAGKEVYKIYEHNNVFQQFGL